MIELCEHCGAIVQASGCGCRREPAAASKIDLLDVPSRAPPRPASLAPESAPISPISPIHGPIQGVLTWEWLSPTGDTIFGRIDPAIGLESVYVGQRLVSRAKLGTKPDGHTIAAKPGDGGYRQSSATLVATYRAALRTFDLRANGQLVTPTRAPAVASASLPPRPFAHAPPPPALLDNSPTPWLKVSVVLGTLLMLAAIGVGVLRHIKSAAASAPPGSITATTKIIQLPYPKGYKPEPEKSQSSKLVAKPLDLDCKTMVGTNRVCDVDDSVIVIRNVAHDSGVFAFSIRTNGFSMGTDPWLISNIVHDLYAEHVEKEIFAGKNIALTERARADATCVGKQGAAVTSTLVVEGETGTFSTCTFLHERNVFVVGYYVNAKVAGDEPSLQKIVDGFVLLAP